MLPKLTETTQTISFSEGDGVCSAEVFASNVIVTTNAGNHDHGSSKVKLKNLVDYNWEPKFYPGQLLAIHISGKYLAYSIKAPNAVNPGTWTGMVRVVYYPDPGTDRRALIKGMKGEVQDLSFAHIQNQVVLACIDEQGNFYVHEIEVTDSGLRCSLIAEIREDTGVIGSSHRVVWCPYIPDEDDDTPDDDVARLLLTTHSNIGRIWNMREIASRVAPSDRSSAASQLMGGAGALAAGEHSAPIVDAAFSPDGTALATASHDGYVMFFQVCMVKDTAPRCLHKWQPHGGAPLSCLFFLDNHKNYNSEVQFWKFAVTGAENNTVIKIWSCKSWNCLQTIAFGPSVGAETSLGLKAMLDASATYLFLSDFQSRSLYVVNIAQDADDATAYCRCISEFLLPYPVLSYCIVDADEHQAKCESNCDDHFHRNGSSGDVGDSPDDFDLHPDEEGRSPPGVPVWRVAVRLFIVQPKGLQEGLLSFTPPAHDPRDPRAPLDPRDPHAPHADLLQGLSDLAMDSKSPETVPALASSILQQQSQQLKNLLMRTQDILSLQTQPGSLIGQRPESPTVTPQLNLMTPDAFSSPGKREEEDPPLSATPDVSLGTKPRTSTGGAGGAGEAAVGAGAGGGGGKLTSGGSSPSREVQQIMAHNEDPFFDKHMDEELPSPIAEAGSSSMPNGTEPIFAGEIIFPSTDVPAHPHKLTHANSDTSWPQISIAQIAEANQRKASSEKSSSHSLNNSTGLVAGGDEGRVHGHVLAHSHTHTRTHSPLDHARLDMLEQKLDKLTELITQQSRELRTLRGSATCPREVIEEVLLEHTQRTTQAIENALTVGWERIASAGESASCAAAQAAGVGAARALEPLAKALQHELAAKLSATDHLLRDNIDKLANSKMMCEKLSASIAQSLSELVKQSFREALAEGVIPLMEKALAQIFRQVNHAFQQGTKEFAANTEAAARAAAERGGAAAAASLQAALERHAEALAKAAHAQSPPNQHQWQTALREIAHSVLEKEMSWWREQARSVAVQMSRAHSPATTHTAHSQAIDRQMQVAQVQALMASGDMNGAFQQALSASDLALVMCACRSAEPGAVFGPPCRLKQHVLLSLVQQLAADMARDTHLKHRYLEEAVMNLDTSNPVTREHLPGVVRELQKQVAAFLAANPGHALARHFRMLAMAADSLASAAQ